MPPTKTTTMKDINFHYYNNREKRYSKIPARKITLPGFEDFKGFELAIHKSPGGSGWHVSECKSGLFVGTGRTQKDAIANAEERTNRIVQRFGVEELVSSIARAIELQGGISPMFGGSETPTPPPSRGVRFNELMGILGFKPPIDATGGVDVIKLGKEFEARDADYNDTECTYKGEPVSISGYIKLKHGSRAVELLASLI